MYHSSNPTIVSAVAAAFLRCNATRAFRNARGLPQCLRRTFRIISHPYQSPDIAVLRFIIQPLVFPYARRAQHPLIPVQRGLTPDAPQAQGFRIQIAEIHRIRYHFRAISRTRCISS